MSVVGGINRPDENASSVYNFYGGFYYVNRNNGNKP